MRVRPARVIGLEQQIEIVELLGQRDQFVGDPERLLRLPGDDFCEPVAPHCPEELLVGSEPAAQHDGPIVMIGDFLSCDTKAVRADKGSSQAQADIEFLMPALRRIRHLFQTRSALEKCFQRFDAR